jgi:hypothetical protein
MRHCMDGRMLSPLVVGTKWGLLAAWPTDRVYACAIKLGKSLIAHIYDSRVESWLGLSDQNRATYRLTAEICNIWGPGVGRQVNFGESTGLTYRLKVLV